MRRSPAAAAAAAAAAFGVLGASGAGRSAGAQSAGGPAARPLAAVRGVVFDSLSRRPLDSAAVQLVNVDDPAVTRGARSDSTGAYRIDSVPPGRYAVGFQHATLDLLGVELGPRAITVAPGAREVRANLAVPSLLTLRDVLCAESGVENDSTGVLAGRVRDAATGEPVAGATVEVSWVEVGLRATGLYREPRRVPATTSSAGSYAVCGLPPGQRLDLRASAPGRASGDLSVEVPAWAFAGRDVTLGALDDGAPPAASDTAGDARPRAQRRGTARLAGRVVGPRGEAVPRASVFVRGTDAAVVADERGEFRLAGLPAGTRMVEARAIGLEPGDAAVDFFPARESAVEVRLTRPVATLDRVTVYGKAIPRNRGLEEFYERRRLQSGFGTFISREEIERQAPFFVTDLLRMAPGIFLVPAGPTGNVILGRRSCRLMAFVDGNTMPLDGPDLDAMLRPQDIAGIEVYSGIATAPLRYVGLGGAPACGAVLIWTRR